MLPPASSRSVREHQLGPDERAVAIDLSDALAHRLEAGDRDLDLGAGPDGVARLDRADLVGRQRHHDARLLALALRDRNRLDPLGVQAGRRNVDGLVHAALRGRRQCDRDGAEQRARERGQRPGASAVLPAPVTSLIPSAGPGRTFSAHSGSSRRLRSSAGAECVRAPTEMKSTPVSETPPTVASEIPPEASRSARWPGLARGRVSRGDCRPQPRQLHVVEQQPVGLRGQRLLDLGGVADLDLDRHLRLGRRARGGPPRRSRRRAPRGSP